MSDTGNLDSGAFADCGFDPSQQTIHQVTPNPNGGPDQVFDGSVSATAAAVAGFTDTLDVTAAGGPGVYSLHYIFSVDGSLAATDESLLSAEFCAVLSLPEGTGTQTSTCSVSGQSVCRRPSP
jgi:hypothetical protein